MSRSSAWKKRLWLGGESRVRNRWFWLVVVVCGVLVFAGRCGFYSRTRQTPFAFEGVILEVHTGARETKVGGVPMAYVRVRDASGREFDLELPYRFLGVAKPGMRIHRDTSTDAVEVEAK
jgi:hypothetical protein